MFVMDRWLWWLYVYGLQDGVERQGGPLIVSSLARYRYIYIYTYLLNLQISYLPYDVGGMAAVKRCLPNDTISADQSWTPPQVSLNFPSEYK